MTTQKIVYFEYGGQMTCHYSPSQDNLTTEDFLNKLKVFRKEDVIRVDWHSRFINLNYIGGEQEIKVYVEEREWNNNGNSTRKSYQLVKSLSVPEYHPN